MAFQFPLTPILDRARSHWMAVPALLFPLRQRLMALRGRPRASPSALANRGLAAQSTILLCFRST